MIELIGTLNSALCYADTLEPHAREQILAICSHPAFADAKVRIMPDVHAGTGCTIGTTLTVTDKIVPAMVGVDIGCGMETVLLREREIDFATLDAAIRSAIPSGRDIRTDPHPYASEIDLSALRCADEVNLERAYRSIGTLGGGNHFIEVDRDDDGNLYLVVHSGSRHLGIEVAEYYGEQARLYHVGAAKHQREALIASLRAAGRYTEIQPALVAMKAASEAAPPDALAYLEGQLFDDYLHDMRIVQQYASLNRAAMIDAILSNLSLTECDRFVTVHNYVDLDAMILRKGAVSAKAGEKLLIPINMRDGSLVCIGKGNEDWNCSAPHGAGRLMSRKAARHRLTLEEYAAEMLGVYSTCISESTLDESPMAYKPMDEIVANIGPTADIVCRIRPIYNFKATE